MSEHETPTPAMPTPAECLALAARLLDDARTSTHHMSPGRPETRARVQTLMELAAGYTRLAQAADRIQREDARDAREAARDAARAQDRAARHRHDDDGESELLLVDRSGERGGPLSDETVGWV
ncbi:hypothetical protein ABT160_43570 [Streptomyces sp. NPDC001941]|uniref:hypothetical protein n=1 Tax=Streptomyces sp. NPDC001941 TaxID=3154659 RepID=UPI003321591B